MNERQHTKTTLETLIEAGLLHQGERLYASKSFSLRENGYEPIVRHFEAELAGGNTVRVVSDGADGSLNGREYASASAAISALYERADSGWHNWKVERDGERVTLSTIRHEHDLRQPMPALEPLDEPAPEAGLSAVTPAATEISRDFRN